MPTSRLITLVTTLMIAAMSTLAVGSVAAQESGMSVTVELQEYDGSGISGTAYLTETSDGGTHVSMVLVGGELDGNHPTHIHTGTCDNFDPNPLYPLETVNLNPVSQDGTSESTVADVDLAALHEGDYVILVHQSPEELTNYLVCGEISAGTTGTAELTAPGSTPTMHHVPVTGDGYGMSNESSGSDFVLLFSALAIVSAMAFGAIRITRRNST
jgi:hypothetical protein